MRLSLSANQRFLLALKLSLASSFGFALFSLNVNKSFSSVDLPQIWRERKKMFGLRKCQDPTGNIYDEIMIKGKIAAIN